MAPAGWSCGLTYCFCLFIILSCFCGTTLSWRSIHTKDTDVSNSFELDSIELGLKKTTHGADQVGRTKRAASRGVTEFAEALNALHDNNTQASISWAGQYSDKIVVLTKSGRRPQSILYVSSDYGKSYGKPVEDLCNSGVFSPCPTSMDKIYHSHISWAYNSYIFTDTKQKLIVTTRDLTVFNMTTVVFTPNEITICPHSNSRLVAALDTDSYYTPLYISKDFGLTWTHKYSRVKTFFWGDSTWDYTFSNYFSPAFYIEVFKGYRGLTKLVRFNSSEDIQGNVIEDNTVDFLLKSDYKFVVKRVNSYNTSKAADKRLYVSYRNYPFAMADIPHDVHSRELEYFVVDSSEDQVFLCVTHDKFQTDLYISDENGTRYTRSLPRVVFYNPDGPFPISFLRILGSRIVADVTKISGINGIYFASQLTGDVGNFSSLLPSINTVASYDKGATWRSVTAPFTNSTGHYQHCYKIYGCSLHFAQDLFSRPPYLYSSMLSSKNAVGLVMSTGVYGRSYNHTKTPQTFFSSDAGWNWKDVVNGTYHYAYGDHGGVIVAVPKLMHTTEVMYSIDEGSTWTTESFSTSRMIVYGLLTEPGSRTMVFTLWGAYSDVTAHSWVVVQLNFTTLFSDTCSQRDYKEWTPHTPSGNQCLLGVKTAYERRAPHSRCANGEDYYRTVSTTVCDCTRDDYECDDGYEENMYVSWRPVCVKMNGTAEPAVPYPCPVGSTYTRTKGYRKIAGDQCHDGLSHLYEPTILPCPERGETEFIIYATSSAVHMFDLDTRRDSQIPISGSYGSVKAVEYDHVNHTVFFADNRHHSIKTVDLRTSYVSTLLYLNQSVNSLCLDWYSNNLYWLTGSGGPSMIEVASTSGEWRDILVTNNSSGGNLTRADSLVIVPSHGMMFWSDATYTSNPGIVSAYMNGSNVQRILKSSSSMLRYPRGITVDDDAQLIYVADSGLHHIFRCTFSGTSCSVVVSGSSAIYYPHDLGVFKNEIFWTDGRSRCLRSATMNPSGSRPANTSVTHNCTSSSYTAYSLRVIDSKRRAIPSPLPPCANGGNCLNLCLLTPDGSGTDHGLASSCLCAGGSVRTSNGRCVCPGGKGFDSQGFCQATNCSVTQHACGPNICINPAWVCDGHRDCANGLDEKGCPYHTCATGMFRCPNSGVCISNSWLCDHDNDCGADHATDEANCNYPPCLSSQFTCANKKCIRGSYTCDGDNDCGDHSDEQNCNGTVTTTSAPVVCNSTTQFTCAYPRYCIHLSWHCDGTADCSDGSDEVGCATPATPVCPHWQWQCANGECINYGRCDGTLNCLDGSDERGCNVTTPVPISTRPPCWWGFRCNNNNCIPRGSVCDRSYDCGIGDISDELNCYYTTRAPPPSSSFPPTRLPHCNPLSEFTCSQSGGACIAMRYHCDGSIDCPRGEDELFCSHSSTQSPNFCFDGFPCLNLHYQRACLPLSKRCDGRRDCFYSEDESQCASSTTVAPAVSCHPSQFKCTEESNLCIDKSLQCNGDNDCPVNLLHSSPSDETNCTRRPSVLQSRYLRVGLAAVTVNSINVSIGYPTIRHNFPSAYAMVSYKKRDTDGSADHWKNLYAGTRSVVTIGSLREDTEYDIQVSVRIPYYQGTAMVPLDAQTRPGVPLPVGNLTVSYKQVLGSDVVEISFNTPSNADPGTQYQYWFGESNLTSSVIPRQSCFGGNCTYRATNFPFMTDLHHDQHENVSVVACIWYSRQALCSKPVVQVVTISHDAVALAVTATVNAYRIDLSWNSIAKAHHYNVRYMEDSCEINLKVTENQASALDLISGYEYSFHISALEEDNNPVCNPAVVVRSAYGGTGPPSIGTINYTTATSLLHWTLKDPSVPVDVFEVMYSHIPRDLEMCNSTALGSQVATTSFQFPETLPSCETIYYRVRAIKPHKGPFTSMDNSFLTPTAPDAPPKSVSLTDAPSGACRLSLPWYLTCQTLRWTRGCEHDGEESYTVTVTPLPQGPSVDPPRSHNIQTDSYTFVAPRGQKYNFHITDLSNHATTIKEFSAPSVPAITSVSCQVETSTLTMVSWTLAESFTNYAVGNAPGSSQWVVFRDDNGNLLNKTTSQSALLRLENVNSLSVRVEVTSAPNATTVFKTASPTCFYHQPFVATTPNQGVANPGLTIGLPVAAACIIFLLATVLTVWCVKHRRLQRSFMNFAHSRYDTRTGTTTFATDDDEEDAPMIQGFSDDEPLVVP